MYWITYIDRNLFLYLNGHHTYLVDKAMVWISDLFIWLPLYYFIFLIFLRYYKKESYTYLNTILAFILPAMLFVISFKVFPQVFAGLHRVRPCYNPEISSSVRLVGTDCGDVFDFFTPRTCLAFALLTFSYLLLDKKFKWVNIILLVWALLVSYSRIYVGVHYPSDVFVAAVVGVFSGYVSYRVYAYIKHDFLLI